jgi:hypothetical protein
MSEGDGEGDGRNNGFAFEAVRLFSLELPEAFSLGRFFKFPSI